MSEFFSNGGIHLSSPGFITVYQAPDGEPEDSGIVLGAIAAYVGAGDEGAVLEARVLRPGEGVRCEPVQRALIGPGQSVDLMPSRFTLLAGERLQFRCRPPGLLDVFVSTLDFTADPANSSLRPVEVIAFLRPPQAVGGDVGGALEIDPILLTVEFGMAEVLESPELQTDPVTVVAVFAEASVPTPDP
jgi:hypothetical protein